MGAKEKAKELVSKFTFYQLPEDKRILVYNAKECALIDVNNTIEALSFNEWQNQKIINFYNEIKQEIIKL